MEPNIHTPQKIFTSRRTRAILSFRRKRDLLWFLSVFTLFIFSTTVLVLRVPLKKPVISDTQGDRQSPTP